MNSNLLKNCLVFGAVMFISSTSDSLKKKTIFDSEKVCVVPYVKSLFNKKMLKTVAAVESNNGLNVKHIVINYGTHAGTSAIGFYGLMPPTIIETIKKNPTLNRKYYFLLTLKKDQLKKFLEDHIEIQEEIAESHLERLVKIFGKDPKKIGAAWLMGIEGAKKIVNSEQDLNEHWHVKKIIKEFVKN